MIVLILCQRHLSNIIICQIVTMKIKAHNLTTKTESEQKPALKSTKVATRENLNKNNAKTLKENILPHENLGDNKKNIKNADKTQTTQTTIRMKVEKQANNIGEYEKQIMIYIKGNESMYRIGSNYLRNHNHVTHQFRAGLVKFFFKIGRKHKLKRSTIFLAVYYMDAFLEKNPQIQKKQAVIIAQACLFIAMKYEQIYPPQLYDWVHNIQEVIIAQALVLKALDFNLIYSSIQTYLNFYFSKLDLAQTDKQMIKLIADVSLFDQSMYTYTPCQLSSAMIYSIVNREKLEEKMEMSLKWMLERNEKYMEWLQVIKISKASRA